MDFDVINDIPTTNKTILLLTDLNVPLDEQMEIIDDQKIKRAMLTINYLVKTGARVVIATHLGNPINNMDFRFSTKPIAKYLDKRLRCNVKFCQTCTGDQSRKEIFHSNYGDIVVLENLLFEQKEKTCDINFAQRLSDGINIYVNDAFEYSNYPYASTLCVPLFVRATAGLNLANNVKYLNTFFLNSNNIFSTAIVGGRMIDKIDLLNNLIERKINCIIVGGLVANNCLKALNYNIGNSLFEPTCIEIASKMLENAKKQNVLLVLPNDVCVSEKISKNDVKNIKEKKIDKINDNEIIVGLGKESIKNIYDILSISKNIFFYGCIGVNEINKQNTTTVLNKIAQITKKNKALSLIGGKETVLTIKESEYLKDFSFISNSPSMLQYMSGKILPGIEILKRLKKQIF